MIEAQDDSPPDGRVLGQDCGEADRPAGEPSSDAHSGAGPGAPGLAGKAGSRPSGRRPKLSRAQQAAMIAAALSGPRTAAQLARHYQVSEPTVSRILAAYRRERRTRGAGGMPPAADTGGAGVLGVLPAAALHQRLAVVGISGSGKTYATKGLVERLLQAGARVCIVDPLGVWWGLRLGPDGSTPADTQVVVFGGRHGDIPLVLHMGDALGRLVGTQQLACVVDVSDLGNAAARRGFMTAFTAALHESNTEPLHLVLDEADLWAPQRVQADGYDLLGRIEEIVRRGRVRGFIPWLVTQRPAVLHKDVLSQADVLVAMQLTASQDRAAVGRWIEGQADRAEGRRILAALPRLARGEGWIWAPSHGVLDRVAFPPIGSFDSSGTPGRGEANPDVGPRPPVDLAALEAALGEAGPDHADPGAAHWQVRALDRQLRQREQELAAATARIAELEARRSG
jgi:transposase-like protein